MLCPVLGSSVEERLGALGVVPAQGWEDDSGLSLVRTG